MALVDLNAYNEMKDRYEDIIYLLTVNGYDKGGMTHSQKMRIAGIIKEKESKNGKK